MLEAIRPFVPTEPLLLVPFLILLAFFLASWSTFIRTLLRDIVTKAKATLSPYVDPGYAFPGILFESPKHVAASRPSTEELTQSDVHAFINFSLENRSIAAALANRHWKSLKAIARYSAFHQKALVPFGAEALGAVGTPTFSVSSCEQIINQIIRPAIHGKNPMMYVVHGEIGCGKSTMFQALAYALLLESARGHTSGLPVKFLPIIIDVRTELKSTLAEIIQGEPTPGDVIEAKLDEAMANAIGNAMGPSIIGTTRCKRVHEALRIAYNKGYNPIIMIDEVDTIYYEFCKVALLDSGHMTTKSGVFRTIVHYFGAVTADDVHRTAYNNSVFFVALRENTHFAFRDYHAYDNDNQEAHAALLSARSIVIPRKVDAEARELLAKRLEFKSELLSSVAANSAQLQLCAENAKRLLAYLRSDETSLEENLILSVHGLRHIVSLFYKAERLDASGQLLLDIFSNETCRKIFQFVDGGLTFSQVKSGISNAFLVNNGYAKKLNEVTPGKAVVPDRFVQPHLQTYHLKLVLLSYMYEIDRQHKHGVSANEIVMKFCRPQAGQHTYFEEEIVRLILMHATEADHGRLIRVTDWKDERRQTLHLTSRAMYMIKHDIFWTFPYLLVIVEDEWLEFPRKLLGDFRIREPKQRAYDFVTRLGNMNFSEKKSFLEYKARTVLMFSEILRASLEHEKARYRLAFDILGREHPGFEAAYLYSIEKQNVIERSTARVFADILKISPESAKEQISMIKAGIVDRNDEIEAVLRHSNGEKSLFSTNIRMARYHRARADSI